MQTHETMAPHQPERTALPEQAREEVFTLLDRVTDPQDTLHQTFYGEHGVTDAPLRHVRHPFGGSTVLLADETSHVVRYGNEIHDVRTFKRRGALMAALLAAADNPDMAGFVTASAGNHALGVASAAKALGKTADIFCSTTISAVKKEMLEGEFGASVHDVFTDIEEALDAASQAQRLTDAAGNNPLMFIHPFDDVAVIAGQATIGLHLARQIHERRASGELDPSMEVEVGVNVGGGGLLAGVLLGLEYAMRQGWTERNVSVVGAQMLGANAMELALKNESMTYFDASCDGTAVKQVGVLTKAIIEHSPLLKRLRSVDKLAVARGMRMLTSQLYKKVEPAAALAWTLQLEDSIAHRDAGDAGKKAYIPLVTGANVTQERYDEYQDVERNSQALLLGAMASAHQVKGSGSRMAPQPTPAVRRGLRVWQ